MSSDVRRCITTSISAGGASLRRWCGSGCWRRMFTGFALVDDQVEIARRSMSYRGDQRTELQSFRPTSRMTQRKCRQLVAADESGRSTRQSAARGRGAVGCSVPIFVASSDRRRSIHRCCRLIDLAVDRAGRQVRFRCGGALPCSGSGWWRTMFGRQLIFAAASAVVLIFTGRWGRSLPSWRPSRLMLPWVVLVLVLIALAATLIPELAAQEARRRSRWLQLGPQGLGAYGFQPSEFAKLALIGGPARMACYGAGAAVSRSSLRRRLSCPVRLIDRSRAVAAGRASRISERPP